MKNRILITGISGLLGANIAYLYHLMRNYDSIYGTINKNPFKHSYANIFKVDFNKSNDFNFILHKYKPRVLIHTAALTSVEKCEHNPAYAFKLNSEVPAKIAKICNKERIKFVFISTDMVYNTKNVPHKETEKLKPLNVYAKSKAEAERLVLQENSQALIVRTNFFGWSYQNKQSFAEWIIHSLSTNTHITLFYDVTFSPIYIPLLSKILQKAILKDLVGIFNIGAPNSISKLDFGRQIGMIFKLNTKLIIPISIEEKTNLVQRPKQMEMSIGKIRKALKIKIPNVEEQIALMWKDYKNKYQDKLKND